MKNENFITIQGWMMNDLKLKGNELILYALIYGFSQDGESEYYGSIRYIMKALRLSNPCIQELLKKLLAKKLIEKTSESHYKVYKKVIQGVQESYTPSVQESYTNKYNTNNNILAKNKKNFLPTREQKENPNQKEQTKLSSSLEEKEDAQPIEREKLTNEGSTNEYETNRAAEIMELKTRLAKLDPCVSFASDYKADHNPPKKKEQLTGWQKVYSDLVKWYQKEYKCEVLGWQKQYTALRSIRKIKPDMTEGEFGEMIKVKMAKLADEDWHQGQFDFGTLVSQWHKLGDAKQRPKQRYMTVDEIEAFNT